MDSKELFAKNVGLAKTSAGYWSKRSPLEFDDCHQLCLFGLYKASKTYKEGKGAKFNTWAVVHMNNVVKDELRKLEKRVPEVLMQHTSEYDEDTSYKGLEEFGEYDNKLEQAETSIELSKIAHYIKDLLTEREWNILWLIAVEDVPQDKIAEMYSFQQPHVSRIMKGIRRKITQD
ncbi:MAG: sigma-70 family RNA polymerase sigma factor, partial [Chloroflexota bacterium]